MDSDSATLDTALLQKCPWCAYSLRGLPVEHRCPECGHETDRRSRVFENAPSYWRTVTKVFAGIGCAYIGLNLVILSERFETSHAIFLGAISLFFFLFIQAQRRRMAIFACVSPKILTINSRLGDQILAVPLDQIRTAFADGSGHLIVELKDQIIAVERFGGTTSDVYICTRYIQSLLN